jgi:hypothetical protein
LAEDFGSEFAEALALRRRSFLGAAFGAGDFREADLVADIFDFVKGIDSGQKLPGRKRAVKYVW